MKSTYETTLVEQSREHQTADVLLAAVEPSVSTLTNVGANDTRFRDYLSNEEISKEMKMENPHYVEYWKLRWKEHPLNNGFKKDEWTVDSTVLDRKADLQAMVELKDVIWRWVGNKKTWLPSRRPLQYIPKRIIRTKHGKAIEVDRPYSTYIDKGQDPNAVYQELHILMGMEYHKKYKYSFTYSNFEAALHMTKHIWRSRLIWKKERDNWQYVIMPMCFQLLYEIAQYNDGTHEAEAKYNKKIEAISTIMDAFNERRDEHDIEYSWDDVGGIKAETTVKTSDDGLSLVQETSYPKEIEEYLSDQSEKSVEEIVESLPLSPEAMEVEEYIEKFLEEVEVTERVPESADKIDNEDLLRWEELDEDQLTYTIRNVLSSSSEGESETEADLIARQRNDIEEPETEWKVVARKKPWKKSKLNVEWPFRFYPKIQKLGFTHALKCKAKTVEGVYPIFTIEEMKKCYFEGLPDIYMQIGRFDLAERCCCEPAETFWKEKRRQCRLLRDDWFIRRMRDRMGEVTEYERVNIPQSAEDKSPNLQAGPSSSGAAKVGGSVTGGEKVDKPVTKGEKHTTMTFVDQREVSKTKAAQQVKKREEDHAVKDIYDMLKICSRPMYIDRRVWSTSDETGKEVLRWVLPNVYFNVASAKPTVCGALNTAYILSMFGAAKFDMKLRVVINSVKFQQGMMMIVFKPFYTEEKEKDIFNNLTCFPHVMIDASVSNSVEMDIPWTNVRDAFPLYADNMQEHAYIGTLHAYVWNKLQTGKTGSIDCTLSFYMWMENLQVYQLAGPKDPRSLNFATDIIRGNNEAFKQTRTIDRQIPISELPQPVTREPQAGMIEGLVDEIGGLAMDTGANLIEHLLQKVARGADAKPSGFNPPQPVVPWVAANSAHGEGIDLSQRLSLQPKSVVRPDASVKPPMNMKDLLSRYTRIGVATWTVNSEENESLVTAPMCPMMPASAGKPLRVKLDKYYVAAVSTECKDIHSDSKFQLELRNPSMLDYISHLYHYWHGSLKYKLEVVCTSMHSGRLYVRYEPYGDRDVSLKECEKAATPGVNWEIQEKHSIEVVTPYMTTTPFLNTFWHPDPGEFTSDALGNTCGGFLEMTVVNRLKVTTGISDTVDINIYIAAGDDFEFMGPATMGGVLDFRDWKYGLVTSGVSDNEKSVFYYIDKWWEDSNVMVQKEFPALYEKVKIGEYQYSRVKQTDTSKWYEGFFLASTDTAMASILKTTYSNMRYMILKGNRMPTFTSHSEAFAWLNTRKPQWPSRLRNLIVDAGMEPTSIIWQKILMWYAVPLMVDNIWRIESLPRMMVSRKGAAPDAGISLFSFNRQKPTEKRQNEPQAKSMSGGPAINPFTSFTSTVAPSNSMIGESHTDMYLLMKRWNMWRTMNLPPDANIGHTGTESSIWTKSYYGWIMPELAQLTSWEQQDYVWEYRIPVTPMLRPQHIGMNGHWQQATSTSRQKIVGCLDLAESNFDGGLEVGGDATITNLCYLGQLFTFWRGSLRYRFTFPDANQEDRPPWVLIVYHPKQYTNSLDGPAVMRVANSKQMRDATKLGTVLWNGNVMANVDVEVPFYSRFSRLMTSMNTYDETTTSGSLMIYTPIRLGSFDRKCTDVNYFDLPIKGLRTWIWQAVGDDFEYQVPRAPPSLVLYPLYAGVRATLDYFDAGWDRYVNNYFYNNSTFDAKPIAKHSWSSVHKRMISGSSDIIHSSERLVSPWKGTESAWGRECSEALKDVTLTRQGEIPKELDEGNKENESERVNVPQADTEPKVEEKPPEVAPPRVDTVDTPLPSAPEITIDGCDEIDGMFGKLKEGIENFSKVMSTANVTLTPFVEKVASVCDKLDKVVGDVGVSVTETSSVVKTGLEYTLNASRLGAFFYGIYNIITAETWNERWIPMAACALALGLSPEIVKQAGDWLMANIGAIFSSEKVHEKNKPQAWDDKWNNDITSFIAEHSTILRMIAAGIVTIVAFYVSPSVPSTTRVKTFATDMVNKLRNMAFIGAGLKTLEWMFKWIANVIKDAAIWVADTFSGGMVTAHRMNAHYPDVIAWLAMVEKYDLEAYKGPLSWDTEARVELWKLLDQGKEMTNKIPSKMGTLYNILTKGLCKLNKLDSEATCLKNAPAFRMDPIHISFYGQAGVKKSSILTYVLGFVANELGYPVHNRFYARNDLEDHWNGYDGQLITLIDDFAQNKDGKSPNELISMKSNICWHVPMAHLEDKGKCFTSKIIGSTTNILFPRPDSIQCYQALWRRRNVLVEVTQAYAEPEGEVGTWKNLRFHLINPTPEAGQDMKTYKRKNLNLVELIIYLTETCKQWERVQKAIVAAGMTGRTITLPDYGDGILPEEPVSDAFSMIFEMLRQGIKVKAELLQQYFDQLTLQQIRTIMNDQRCEKTLSRIDGYSTMAAHYILADETDTVIRGIISNEKGDALIKALEEMITGRNAPYIKAEYDDKVIKSIKVVCMGREMSEIEVFYNAIENGEEPLKGAEGGQDEGTDVCGNKATVPPFVLRDYVPKERVTAVKTQVYVNRTNKPQGILEDGFMDSDLEVRKAWQERIDLKTRAEDSLNQRDEMMSAFDQIIESTVNMPRKVKVTLSNEKEISAFVSSHFPKLGDTEKEKLKSQFSRSFNDITKKQAAWVAFSTQKETLTNMKKLFGNECDKFWKKGEADGNWTFDCDGESEEEMELYSLYEVLTTQFGQTEINQMKNNTPKVEDYQASKLYTKVSNFYKAQVEKVTKWFDEHPNIKKIMKICSALVGVFLGYKVIQWLCPSIIEKVKMALGSLFGLTVGVVGVERVDRWKEKGKELVTAGKDKVCSWYDFWRAKMKSSDDAQLREWADEPDTVELFAESMSRLTTHAKTAVEMKRHVDPEAKKSRMNAYMLGQDRKTEDQRLTTPAPRINEMQGCVDEQARDLRNNLLSKGMVRVYWANMEKSVQLSGLMVKGRYLLIPYHFWQGCPRDQSFVIANRDGNTFWEKFEPEFLKKIPDEDVSLYLCSKRVGQFANLVKHFPDFNEIKMLKSTPATLTTMSADRQLWVQPVIAEQVSDITYKLDDGTELNNTFAWDYDAKTGVGDCGAVLLADNPRITKKILGIHVSGVKGQDKGTSAYISRSELLRMMEELPDDSGVLPVSHYPQSLITKGVDQMKIQPQGNFELLGAVDRCNEVRLPHKTEIVPSPIHDKVREHTSEPSVLSPNDPRLEVPGSPLLRAINKYGQPTYPFPPRDVRLVFRHICKEVLHWKVHHDARILTDWEAVFGNEYIDYCDRMNLAASPGFPWTLSRPSGEKGKAYLFDINAEDGIAAEDFRHRYQAREKLAKAGIIIESVWTDCLKDERRPIAKIKAGKTRAFMLPPADFSMMCRKYFMMFCVNFYSNRIDSFSAVGIDPYSSEWTRVVRKLRKNSNLAFAGDFHSFDGIFDPIFMWEIMKIINLWYLKNDPNWTAEDDRVRQCLTEEMIHTVHICKNSIYMKHQGNPSGNPLTVVVNTFAHYAYILLSWIGLARENSPESLSMHAFDRNVAALFYGDDGLYTVKKEASEWFNCKSVSDYLKSYGIEYTDEGKTGELYGVKDLTECTFLKNGFKRLEGTRLWLAPISQDTIYELTNWIRKTDQPIEQMRDNLADVFSFAFHHGEEFFWKLLIKVNEALDERKLKGFVTSYELEKEKFLAKCLN